MAGKRIMRKFRIGEISAVDRPAQAGARMVLMKRAGDLLDDKQGEDDVKKEVVRNSDGYSAEDFAYVPDPSMPSTWKLRLTSTPGGAPDPAIVGAAAAALSPAGYRGQRVDIPQADAPGVRAKVRAAWKKANPDKDVSEMPDTLKFAKEDTTMADPTNGNPTPDEQLAAAQAKIAELEAKLQSMSAAASMTDTQKRHYNTITKAEDKAAFEKATSSERDIIVTKANEANAVVYKALDGTEYRKSDDERLVRLAKQADEAAKLAKAERAARLDADYTKRADALDKIGGEPAQRMALIKAVDGIEDETTRTRVHEILKAANTAMGGAFEVKGVSKTATATDADEKLDALAKKYQTENKGTDYAKAYAAILDTDEGRELYKQAVQ